MRTLVRLTAFSFLFFSFQFVLHAQIDRRLQEPGGWSFDDVTKIDSSGILICGSNYFGTTLNNNRQWSAVNYGGMFVEAADFSSLNFGIGVGGSGRYRTNIQCGYFWGWSSVQNIGTSNDLTDVHMFNDMNGAVSGEGGKLFVTNDQAASWSDIATGIASNLNGVRMLNDSTVIACGNSGVVLKMVNGVVSISTIDAAQDFFKITFITDSTGYISGSNGRLYRTIDQGDSWTQIPAWTNKDLLNLDFYDLNNGIVGGEDGVLFYTNDGGLTWISTYNFETDDIKAICYINDTNVIAVGFNYKLESYDGGQNWSTKGVNPTCIEFPTNDRGYFFGWLGAMRTIDGGNTWQQMTLNIPAYYYDLSFINADDGYAVGSLTVVKTTDGGDNWTALTHPATNATLLGVDFVDANNGIVVGTKRTLMYTADGGLNWQHSYTSSSSLNYRAVCYTSPSTAYICTSSISFLKTTNGGANWTTTFLPVNTNYNDIFFINPNIGWVVGSNGTILKTTDAGATWAVQNSGTTEGLTGITFKDQLNGTAVGVDGTYLYTTDGGQTWIDKSSGSIDYNDCTMSPNGDGFLVGALGVSSFGKQTLANYSGPYCTGENLSFNSFLPYDDATVRDIVIELETENGDFSNPMVMQTLTIDSVGLINFNFPDNLETGVYKLRARDVNDPTFVSKSRYHKVMKTPELSIQVSGDSLIAITDATYPTLYWYFRPDQNSGSTFVGTGDSILITNVGQYYVSLIECCSIQTEWQDITSCNGQFLNLQESTQYDTLSICATDSVLWQGTYYSNAGNYSITYTNINGCDSIHVLELISNSLDTLQTFTTICDGDSVLFEGNYVFDSGVYTNTLSNSNGCDSIIILNLNVNPIYSTNTATTLCYDDSVLFNGNYYNATGFYSDTLQTQLGCDSILTLQLTVLPLNQSSMTMTICEDDSLLFNGVYLTDIGTYIDTLTSVFSGCDSIVTLNLNQYPFASATVDTSICVGDSIEINNSWYTSSGSYTDSLTSINGCDSILTLNIQLFPQPPAIDLGSDQQVCEPNTVELDAGAGFQSYAWSSGDTTQVISIDSDTLTYIVIGTDQNDCTSTDSVEVAIVDCWGISEIETFQINVYPNPTAGSFAVEGDRDYTVELHDMTGKLIVTRQLNKGKTYFDSVRPGVYNVLYYWDGALIGRKSVSVTR